jgi:hypothetical protein
VFAASRNASTSLCVEHVAANKRMYGVREFYFLLGGESVRSELVEEAVVVDVACDGVGRYGEVVVCWHVCI